MPKVAYEKWSPAADAVRDIARAEIICSQYARQGYSLTLRQLYYRFVAAGYIPNNLKSYKRLGSIINRARMAGLLDWDYIVDRTRSSSANTHFSNPGDAITRIARGYGIDKWVGQSRRVEVWVEKEALIEVIEQVASRNDVRSFACRGYVSQSEQWAAAQRIGRIIAGGQGVVILHLGDHDPSGIDMTRDITERIDTFILQDWYNSHPGIGKRFSEIRQHMRDTLDGFEPFDVRRIALNMDQVEQYDPPPNPAKLTDSRVGKYLDTYGDQSWELDALEPNILDDLIQRHIDEVRDPEQYERMEALESSQIQLLRQAAARWGSIARALRRQT